MGKKSREFGDLLTKGIKQLSIQEQKPINLIQDNLAYQLNGVNGGTGTISYFRRGHIPTQEEHVAIIAQYIFERANLGHAWLKAFLLAAEYTAWPQLLEQLDPDANSTFSNGQPAIQTEVPGRNYGRLIGRESVVDEVLAVLNAPNRDTIIGIDGIGGIGKSVLAIDIANQCLETGLFEFAIWVSAAPIQSKKFKTTDLTNIMLEQLDPTYLLIPEDERYNELKKQLKTRRTIVVVDNLDTAHDPQKGFIQQLIPLLGHSKALLTSRKRFSADVYPVHLSGLSNEECGRLIEQEIDRKNLLNNIPTSKNMERIAISTGGSPYAIKLVVGQLQRLELDTVLKHLEQAQPIHADSEEDEYYALYHYIFFPSWQLLSANSQGLLLSLSHFPINGGGSTEAVQAASQLSDQQFVKAIDQLWCLSLLEVNQSSRANAKRYYMHSLTHFFVRSDLPKILERQSSGEKQHE